MAIYNLFYRLSTFINSESVDTIDYYIAKSMLDDIGHIAERSIGEVAEKCNVSKSMISKFVRKLGYEDYIDFKWSGMVEEGRLYYTEDRRTINITDYIYENGVNKYLKTLIEDIRNMFKNADITKIDKLAHYLHEYKKIGAFGLGYSESAALNLSHKMAFYHKFIYTALDETKQNKYIEKAGEDTLLIFFSNLGRYFINSDDAVKETHKKSVQKTKAKTVLITSNREMENYIQMDLYIFLDYTKTVQNHPVIYQLLIEQIALRYQQAYGLPEYR